MLIFFLFGVFLQVALCEWDQLFDPEELKNIPGYGSTWMFMPDGDGVPRVALLEGEKNERQNRALETDITFNLYTRNSGNETYILEIGNKDLLELSNLDLNKEIKFVTHGWRSSNKSESCQTIKDAYVKVTNYNVIVVDWYPLSKDIIYPIPAESTKFVGKEVARMMKFLVENGASFDKMHCIGHSLGSHVCGFAGENVESKLGRITGLDPAGPGFTKKNPEEKLESSDAKFVDIIHTGYPLGDNLPAGHVDFYPNKGKSQPGCFMNFTESCSHSRAWRFFSASILDAKAFPSKQCTSWIDYEDGHCKNSITAYMGEFVDKKMRGEFYLRTTAKEPFKSI